MDIIKGGRGNLQTDSGEENSYGSLKDLRIKRMSDSRESPQFGCEITKRDGIQSFGKITENEELEGALCQNNTRFYQGNGGALMKPFKKHFSLYSFNKSEQSSVASENSPQVTNQITKEINESSKLTPKFTAQGRIYGSQGTRHLSLSNNTSPFKNQLPQYAEIIKMQSSKLIPSESPQINMVKSSKLEEQCPQYIKRRSAFNEKSHISISSIYSRTTNQNNPAIIQCNQDQLKRNAKLAAKSQIVQGTGVENFKEKNDQNSSEIENKVEENNKKADVSSNSIRLKNSSSSVMYQSAGSNAFNIQ